MPAKKSNGDPYERIAELERENTELKIQLLTITRDLGALVAQMAEDRLKENGWGHHGQKQHG